MDAIRICKHALDRGDAGALVGPSAFYCKHPQQQMAEDAAARMVEEYIALKTPAARVA